MTPGSGYKTFGPSGTQALFEQHTITHYLLPGFLAIGPRDKLQSQPLTSE